MARKKSPKTHRYSLTDRILVCLSALMICGSALALAYVSLMNWSPLAEVVSNESGGNHTASIDQEIQNTGEAQEKTLNFLVTGIDYTTTDASAGTSRGKLTDVIMVVQLDLGSNEVDVLQIPRDTWVGTNASSTGKINAVYGRSGLEGLARTIYDQLSIPLDHYVNVNMDGFINIVDAIGGVEMEITESFTLEGVTFSPGVQTLSGIEAEKFVRERHHRSGGDIGRINAQRAFLAAMLKEFKQLSMSELTSLVPILMQEVTTDLKVGTVLELMDTVMSIDTDNISFYTLPGEGATAYNGQSVWSYHRDATAELLNEHFRPYSDPVPAEQLRMEELRNTTDYYDDNTDTITDLLNGDSDDSSSQ